MAGVVLVAGVDLPGEGDAPYSLLFTMEGLAEDIAAEEVALRQALNAAGAPPLVVLDALSATSGWTDFVAGGGDGVTVVRVGVPPGKLGSYWGQLPPAVQAQAAFCADVGNHLLYARAELDAATTATWLAALRKPALGLGGYAVVMGSPHRAALDVWGYAPDTLAWMRLLKQRWDPTGLLNRGAFLV